METRSSMVDVSLAILRAPSSWIVPSHIVEILMPSKVVAAWRST